MRSDMRKSGLSMVGDLPWGSHFCLFHESKKELLEALAPYFKAGLENNEFCLWALPPSLQVEDARKALKKIVPRLEEHAANGQAEFLPYGRWRAGGWKSGKAVVSSLDTAISRGFDGLRLACNAFPEKGGGNSFAGFRKEFPGRYNVIAAFAYPRDKFDALGLMEVVKHHRFALLRNAGRWEVIESSEARIVKDELKRSEERLRSLFSNMSEGFAYHRILLDESGRPCDYRFLEVNEAFERLTGLKAKNLLGKRVTEVLPGIENEPTDWIGIYGKVALTGQPVLFESYAESIDKWYSVSAFSPHRGFFAVTFNDVTERKRAVEALRASLAEKEILLKELAHRTKNNMHAISSLIGLQAAGIADEKLLRTLSDTQDRIRAMALVHEKLYRSQDLCSVNMREYLGDLVSSLLRTHRGIGEPVSANVDVDDLFFSIDAALPLGLIVNELVVNSLKHAFSPGKRGSVFLSLRKNGEGTELRYRDDGPGLPRSVDLSRVKSLGLKLVYNLAVRQLRGKMEIRNEPVSEFVFKFGNFAYMEKS